MIYDLRFTQHGTHIKTTKIVLAQKPRFRDAQTVITHWNHSSLTSAAMFQRMNFQRGEGGGWTDGYA
jgi:hypothetical protein